jgi:hypothetical protein
MVQNYIDTPNFEVHSLLNFVSEEFSHLQYKTVKSDKSTDTSEERTVSISTLKTKPSKLSASLLSILEDGGSMFLRNISKLLLDCYLSYL